jgi:hypothetical protein
MCDRHPTHIRHTQLFWFLKSEMHVLDIALRYGLILEAFLLGNGNNMMQVRGRCDLLHVYC